MSVSAAEFNGVFALKVRTLTGDGMGSDTSVPSTVAGYGTVPAYISTPKTDEQVVNEKIVHQPVKNVFCNIGPTVATTDHFIVIASENYEILDVVAMTPTGVMLKVARLV